MVGILFGWGLLLVFIVFVLSLVGSIPGAIIGCRGGKFRWCYLGAFVGALLVIIAIATWFAGELGPPGGHW
jgi:hypothetical protein